MPVPTAIATRPLVEADLPEAKRIFHLAFGTYLGLPDPMQFCPDRDYVRTRYLADPSAAVAAEMDDQLVGSNFVSHWGNVGFFGPLTVRPDLWDRGIARLMLEPTMDLLAKSGTTHAGLFTFAQSAKHVGLYRKFGFWPRFLTAIMSRPVSLPAPPSGGWARYSEVRPADRPGCLQASRELTHSIYDGLSVEREIQTVDKLQLGETVLLWESSQLAGLAICHCGANTEAGEGACYVKFGAVRSGTGASGRFERLLDACDALAAARNLQRIEAGVNMARHEAFSQMLARGFQTIIQGVAMHRPNEPGYSRSGVFVIDDWR
jgi:hypothetical protein